MSVQCQYSNRVSEKVARTPVAVPSTAFTFTMKLLWIRICFIAGNCMTVWADVGP